MSSHIRLGTIDDYASVLSFLEPVIRAGDTYALDNNMSCDDIIAYWFSPDKQTYVYEDKGDILGTYYIRANQSGGGSHVCNCGYVTAKSARGRGIAEQMCRHSLIEAKTLGFRAMQYNCVVSTNIGAIRIWKKLGFERVGTLPNAFCHPEQGDVDAFVMYQKL